jgi:hypothetical protein
MKHYISPTTLTGAAAVVVACVVGTILDQRSEAKHSPSDRVMAKQELFVESTPEREAQARIEKLSGVKGAPLLSLEEWEPVTPTKVDGIDVSNLFAGEFSYKKSLTKDFQFSKLVLDASFARPGTFFDLGLPAAGNGSVIIRLSRDGIATFTRSESGVTEPLEVSKKVGSTGCGRVEVLRTPFGQSVVCEGITIAEIKAPNERQGRVFVASNLTAGEVKELSISG